jgi:hypothetical protein
MRTETAGRNESPDLSGPKAAASHRVTVPSALPEYNISVVSEQTAPGIWKAVATVTHATDQAVQATPIPVRDEAFPDAASAQAFAVDAASEWIARNLPRS